MERQSKLKNTWVALSAAQKRDLAQRCGSCVAYLSQVAHGHKSASERFWRVALEELSATPKPDVCIELKRELEARQCR